MLGFGGFGLGRVRGTGPMGMIGGDSDNYGQQDETALDVLRRRYAAGEINEEQFDAMRSKLKGR